MLSMDSTTESQPSKLSSNLRQFRFQKKPLPLLNHNFNHGNLPDCKVVLQTSKMMENFVDLVDSDDEKGPNEGDFNTPIIHDVFSLCEEKTNNQEVVPTDEPPNEPEPEPPFNEAGFIGLKQFFKSVEPSIIEKCLIRAKGDCVKAKQYVREILSGQSTCLTINEKNELAVVEPTPTAQLTSSTTATTQYTLKSPVASQVKSSANSSPATPIFNQSLNSCVATTPVSTPPQVKPAIKRQLGGVKSGQPGKKYKRIKKARRDSEFDLGGDSDGNDGGFSKEHRVYDSDEDSDVEVSNETNSEQGNVLEFLCNATLSELLCVPQISKKKAEAIMEQRPFEGWRDMVEKLKQGKGLGTEALNSVNEFLYTRHVVSQLMKKCSNLAAQLEKSNFTGNMALKTQPSLINPEKKLAVYQMIGLNWLLMLRDKKLNGILADEMGLGKTVQVIAFLARLKETVKPERRKPHLIVVPASTLENWSNEIMLWCPSLQISVYYGNQEERKAMRLEYAGGGVKDHDVVLTTYNLLTSSPAERKMFRVLEFDYVIFDEAHMLKNMKTVRYENLSHINAKRRILLTGTPLQNNLLELMSLLTFVMPDLFYNKTDCIKCLFASNAGKEKKENLEMSSEPVPRFEQEQIAQAKKIMKPFVLRRLKKDVLQDLPNKIDHLRPCEMSERQRKMYDDLIRTFSRTAIDKTDNGSGGKTMSMMMQLRRAANHPLLIREQYTENHITRMAQLLVKAPNYQEKNLSHAREDLSILSDFELHSLCQAYPCIEKFALSDEYILDSGKFKVLDELMKEFDDSGNRVLIFSQFVIMLDIIQCYMDLRGHKFLRLDGSTAVSNRQVLIDEFNQDGSIKAFLLSTRAGGLGINLTAADTVIIHDMDFNPYNDKQAEDRCHRVGQTKPVTVYRFVSKNSIEEDIYQIASDKLHLEREISSEDGADERVDTKWVLKKALGLDVTAHSSNDS